MKDITQQHLWEDLHDDLHKATGGQTEGNSPERRSSPDLPQFHSRAGSLPRNAQCPAVTAGALPKAAPLPGSADPPSGRAPAPPGPALPLLGSEGGVRPLSRSISKTVQLPSPPPAPADGSRARTSSSSRNPIISTSPGRRPKTAVPSEGLRGTAPLSPSANHRPAAAARGSPNGRVTVAPRARAAPVTGLRGGGGAAYWEGCSCGGGDGGGDFSGPAASAAPAEGAGDRRPRGCGKAGPPGWGGGAGAAFCLVLALG